MISSVILLSTAANGITPEIQDHKVPKVHVYEGVFRFNFHKIDFDGRSNENCVVSPEFKLHYVTWNVVVCKDADIFQDDKSKLMVSLEAVFRNETLEWSCQAEANYKLLPKDSSYNAATTRFSYFDYDRTHSKPSAKELANWKNFINRHLVDDVATIDVTIRVTPPNRIPGIQHTSTKFQMRLLDVSTLDELYSDEAVVRGMRWKVLAMKRNEFLSVFVIVDEDDVDLDYSWDVTTKFQLISLDPAKSVSRKFSAVQFDWTRTDYGFIEYMKWTDLMDPNNKFVVGNTALLQIELSVAKPKPNPIS